MALRLGADAVTKLMLGTEPVSRLYLGTELVWSASPYRTLELADGFDSYTAGQLEGRNNLWINRCYTTSVWYSVEADKTLSCNAGTQRPMNSYFFNGALSSQSQWSSVRVVTSPTASSSGIGVQLRGNTSGAILCRFTSDGVDLRSGATGGTTTGTVLASATYASLGITVPKLNDVIGMTIVPEGSSWRIRVYLNEREVLTWLGAPAYTGSFAGPVINGTQAGTVDDWRAGVM